MLQKKERIFLIQIIRVVCALGVMFSHYIYILNPVDIGIIRKSFLRNTILAYLFMGDLDVEVFFVVSGFLIPFSIKNALSINRIIKKYFSLIIPAVVLTVICFGIETIFSRATNVYNYDIPMLIDDFSIYFTQYALSDKSQYIPNILSQLWFIFPLIYKWTIGYIIFCMCKEKNFKYLILSVFLICLIDKAPNDLLVGLVFGVITIKIQNIHLLSDKMNLFIAFLLLSLAPVIFNSSVYNYVIGKIILYSILGLLFMFMTMSNNTFEESILINKLDNLTLGIFYTHYPIILAFDAIFKLVSECNNIYYIKYVLILVYLPIVYFTSLFFNNVIYKKNCVLIDSALNGISKSGT